MIPNTESTCSWIRYDEIDEMTLATIHDVRLQTILLREQNASVIVLGYNTKE